MERAELARLLGGCEAAPVDSSPTLVSESQAGKFMTAFANALAGSTEIFLGDPQWGAREREQLASLLPSAGSSPLVTSQGYLMIPSGGSGGRLKFARHDAGTIAAAVKGFTRHFELESVNALGVLPLHHVSGLLAWMRCAITRGQFLQAEWPLIEQGTLPDLPAKPNGWVISLVPTQLERLMRQSAAIEWLGGFRIILLSGAPAGGDLLSRAAKAGLRLSPAYGMTETSAMITALRPEEFLAGERNSGTVLPHATIEVAHDGAISVTGESVFHGYYPAWRASGAFETADIGRLDAKGYLHVTGRRDEVIITGGEKVSPAEVEAVLREAGGLTEVVVLALPDAEWGQLLVAVYPAAAAADPTQLQQLISSRLVPAKRPKLYLPLESWPLTTTGKVDREEVFRLAQTQLDEN